MELIFLEEVESTNKYAKEHIKDYNDMTLIYTDNQTNGRGRLDRKWSYAGKDNIYASIICIFYLLHIDFCDLCLYLLIMYNK